MSLTFWRFSPRCWSCNHPGAQRGKTFTLTLKGEALESGAAVVTTLPATISRLAPPKDLQTPDSELLFLVQLPDDAPVGLYPIRVHTENGLSNVLIFSVGDLPEISEKVPNNSIDQAQPITIPVTGESSPGRRTTAQGARIRLLP